MAGRTRVVRRAAALAPSVIVFGLDAVWRGINRILGRRPCRGLVLYYHAMTEQQRPRFARQLDIISAHACVFRAEQPESMVPGRLNAAITFDDGFASVVENAVPELRARAMPFTMFVPTGCLGKRPAWVREPSHPSWQERVLTAEELVALSADPLARIGSHSVSHPDLTLLAEEQVWRELKASRDLLSRLLQQPVDTFSFPHGAYNGSLLEMARRAGYRRVYTVDPTSLEVCNAGFAVGRVAVSPDDWGIEFRLKLAGAYRWRLHLPRALRTS